MDKLISAILKMIETALQGSDPARQEESRALAEKYRRHLTE